MEEMAVSNKVLNLQDGYLKKFENILNTKKGKNWERFLKYINGGNKFAIKKSKNVYDFLFEYHFELWTLLCVAVSKGNIRIVKNIINIIENEKINIQEFGQNFIDKPLHLAILFKHKDIIGLLIDKQVDVEAQDACGRTLLHIAAMVNDGEIIGILVEQYKVNVNIKDFLDNTPLHYAAGMGNIEAVSLLVNKKADINMVNKKDFTPLDEANANKHERVAEALRFLLPPSPPTLTPEEILQLEYQKLQKECELLKQKNEALEKENTKQAEMFYELGVMLRNIGSDFGKDSTEAGSNTLSISLESKQCSSTEVHLSAIADSEPLLFFSNGFTHMKSSDHFSLQLNPFDIKGKTAEASL